MRFSGGKKLLLGLGILAVICILILIIDIHAADAAPSEG